MQRRRSVADEECHMGVDTRKGKKGGGSTPQPGTSTPQPAKASKTSTPQQVNTTKSIPPTPSNPQFEECGTCTKAGLKPDESIKCALCLTTHHLMCIDVCKSQLLTFLDMKKCGFKWFCSPCRPMVEKLNTSENTESASYTKTEALCNSMNLEINNIKSKMEEIQEKINTNFDSLKQSLENPKTTSWADIVSDGEDGKKPDFVQKIAKQVTDTHTKLTMDREDREKNIIIFNVPEDNSESTTAPEPEDGSKIATAPVDNSKPSSRDKEFFNSLCLHNLAYANVPEVELMRLGAKNDKHIRPIKVSFQQSWDKRKLLSNLYKLKSDKKFKNIRIAHDMCEDDRLENKRLLEQAYNMNQQEKPTEYRYKVRGPPWAMKIVKIFSKN